MSFICGDCHKEHPVPTPQEDLDGAPCFDALLRDRDRLLLQNGEWQARYEDLAYRLEVANGQVEDLRKALTKIDALRKRLPDPDCGEQRTTASGIAEIIQAALAGKPKCDTCKDQGDVCAACSCPICDKRLWDGHSHGTEKR